MKAALLGALSLGVIASAAWAGPAEPPTSKAAKRGMALPLAGATVNPDWAELPDADDLSNHFPPLAAFMQLEGRAVIECKVAATGTLNTCEIVSESPTGLGFGRAAVFMADTFRMRPMSLDGTPVDGGTVRVPIRFSLPPGDAAEGADAIDPQPRSPAALALGRRVSAVVADKAQWTEQVSGVLTYLEESENAGGGVVDTPERRAAYAALRAAFDEAFPVLQEQIAKGYAADLSELELTQIAAFIETPAGRAFVEAGRKRVGVGGAKALQDLSKKAGEHFCAQVKCEPTSTAAAATASPGS